MEIAVGSELGIWQEHNDDAHVSENVAPNVALFGVADGFGTLGRGTPAATFALNAVRDYIRRRQRLGAFGARANSPSSVRALVLGALDYANARLYAQSGSHEDFVAGGTSLTAVLVVGHHAFVGHVGDGRAYLLRLGRLEPITNDDAIFTDAVPSAKSALSAQPRVRSLLWRSLGTQSKLEASIAHVELLAGDQLVLCTDGIHRCVTADEIEETLQSSESSAEAVARLLLMTKMRGNLDNGTLIVGRDLLVPTPLATESPVRFEQTFRSVAALVMLLCTALFLAVLIYRAGTIEPNSGAPDTYAADKH
ncbi:MAG: protein phosphatase 2C domain-containing protein [Candidatus Baltobacteraceae bacterium]